MAFILWGVGAFVGTMLAGKVLAMHTLTDATGPMLHDWQRIWMTPALGATAVLILFLLFFRNPPRQARDDVIAGRKEEDLETP